MKKSLFTILLALLPILASAVVKRTINVATAGTLSSYISEDEMSKIEKLTLTGEINGTDLRLLRIMSGGNVDEEDDFFWSGTSFGALSTLDLSGAKIVAGGEYISIFFNGYEYYLKYELNSNDIVPSWAFAGCKRLTSITIPSSVTSIGEYAFYNCTGLTSITIPNSVTCIGRSAFSGTLWYDNKPDGVVYLGNILYCYKGTMPEGTKISIKDGTIGVMDYAFNNFNNCSGLISITIPNSVTYIGWSAFENCSGLTSIAIPSSVTTIGERAFLNCSGLTMITIPGSVTSIGGDAFSGTPWYDQKSDGAVYTGNVFYKYKGTMPEGTKISIKKGTLGIADGAFSGCRGLTSVTIPNSVISIGGSAFYDCSGLTSITIPNSVTSIGWNAFSGCTGLTSITIPNSVTSIGSSAFDGCSGLTSITIPNSVTSIGNYAFSGCSGLTSVTISNSVTCIAGYTFSGCTGLTSISIPGSVTSIGWNAFSGCTGLTSISIPNNVSFIGYRAFSGCTGLTSISIPSNVTSIGNEAFSGCSGLTSVTISMKTIPSGTFYGCNGLKSITIGSGVSSISRSAFDYCNNITSIKVKSGNKVYDSRDNCNAIIKTADNTLFMGCQKTTIPNSVTSIGDYAFSGCSSLTSITIPNSVTTIGSDAFRNCSALTSITIPNSVTSIGDYAFYATAWYNNQPDGVVYAGKVLYIYKGTMPDGTKISIKEGTLGITGGAFSGCTGLTSITIPNSVTSIGSSTFYNCSGLTSVTIPNSVTTIGSHAFYNCTGLTSITIPNSVTSIGSSAFSGCTGLTSVTIPSSVTSIGSYAFWECKALTDVYCYAENVPTTESSSFETSYIPNVTLHVPSGSVDAYKAVEPWNKFKEIVGTTAKVKLNKTKATLEKGNTLTLKATVTPSTLPDKSVTWKSSNTKVATVTSSGKVKGVKAGTATITCTYVATGAKATCKVTVGYVSLNESKVAIQKGKTFTLTPTVYPSSLTDKSVVWKSTDTSVATVTSEGKVKGVKVGTAIIICTSVATSLSTICEVTVGSVSLNKSKAFLEKGKTVTLKATVQSTVSDDKSVVWESSDTKIATVSSSGKVKGVKYGTATITCTSVATGLSATCKVTVGKVVINIPEFTLRRTRTATLVATVYPTTLTDKSVTWESSDPEIATVTSEGKVKGVKAGTATITCTSVATGLSGTCVVTVTASSESRSTEGDGDNTTDIENLENAPALAEPYDVYDLSGRKVRHQVNSLEGLPDGVYIVNGKKILKK